MAKNKLKEPLSVKKLLKEFKTLNECCNLIGSYKGTVPQRRHTYMMWSLVDRYFLELRKAIETDIVLTREELANMYDICIAIINILKSLEKRGVYDEDITYSFIEGL